MLTERPLVDTIDIIKFSSAGKVGLLAFPDAAIHYAKEQLSDPIPLEEVWDTFKNLCQLYCNQNTIEPEWGVARATFKELGLTKDIPLVEALYLPRYGSKEKGGYMTYGGLPPWKHGMIDGKWWVYGRISPLCDLPLPSSSTVGAVPPHPGDTRQPGWHYKSAAQYVGDEASAQIRRNDMINDPDATTRLDLLTKMIGKELSSTLFNRILKNQYVTTESIGHWERIQGDNPARNMDEAEEYSSMSYAQRQGSSKYRKSNPFTKLGNWQN